MIWKRLKGKSFKDIYLFASDNVKIIINNCKYKHKISKRNHVYYNLNRHLFDVNLLKEYRLEAKDRFILYHYLKHSFDLLGSGWKIVNLKDRKEFKKAEIQLLYDEVLQDCPSLDYKSIDWHYDFKYGYRFDACCESKNIKISDNAKYDIKVPWELARMQHLVYIALAYSTSREEKYRAEVICEILDFVDNNPIGYGVNWCCTMDIAIRLSNMVLAIDILNSCSKLSSAFIKFFSEIVYDHLTFIFYHLEDSRDYRGNHYLANIVGLLFGVFYLENNKYVDKIGKFAINELYKALDEQFLEDGGNFEASIPYHKLSLEMMLWGILVIKRWGEYCRDLITTINNRFECRMYKIMALTRFMEFGIKPDMNIYQLGDNDSGHLFRINHYGNFVKNTDYAYAYDLIDVPDEIWDENELSCQDIQLVIDGIKNINKNNFLNSIFLTLWPDSRFTNYNPKKIEFCGYELDYKQLNYTNKKSYYFSDLIDIENLSLGIFDKFGLFVLKNDSFYLAVFAGENGQRGRGGHSHNDKLSYELYMNGVGIESDPGSYVYTASKEWRDRFRSTQAHNVPFFGVEQSYIGQSCFMLSQNTNCRIIFINKHKMVFSCKYSGILHIREFILEENKLTVMDYSNTKFIKQKNFNYYSNGYGKLIKKEGKNNG